ncbi:MAG: hypothetical protein HYT73_00150 [Candidatus Aenigmarchaeota archaeon]|nr:hypothetical protein [Candidatus Aenigmarchaeota archaeon]
MKKARKFTATRIGVMSTAKMYTAIMFIAGLVLGIMTIFFSSLLYPGISYGEGVIIALMMPFLYAAFGFVMGAVSSVIYNFLAKYIGGIELEFREK